MLPATPGETTRKNGERVEDAAREGANAVVKIITEAFRQELVATKGGVDVAKFLAAAQQVVSGKEHEALRRSVAAAYAAYTATEVFCGVPTRQPVRSWEHDGP